MATKFEHMTDDIERARRFYETGEVGHSEFQMRVREFQKVIKTKSTDEAIAWLCHDYLFDDVVSDVPTHTYAELTLRCAIVAHKRDPEQVTARDILDFVDSAVHYDMLWQSLRNRGDTGGEHDYRSDFAAEITQLLDRSGAKTAEIEQILEDLMTDEANPWMKKGSPEWLEVQRSNTPSELSVEDYIAQNEREFAAEAAQRRERERERSKSK